MTKSLICMLLLASALTGCNELDNCAEEQNGQLITIDTGTTHAEAQLFESAPWDNLDPFPAKRLLRFVHELGTRPEIVTTYVSFSADGTQHSDVTENTGNQGRIKCVDAHEIVVMNDTCEEDFYIRVTATASGEGSTETPCATRDFDK
jgi:hypothetical protein